MKYFVAFVLVASLCALAHAKEEACQRDVKSVCGSNGGVTKCNARYAAIGHLESKMQDYIKLQLEKSYEYLLMATHFNSYEMNRPGFQKLYQGLSDRAFDDTIDLIRQVTRRGGSVDFSRVRSTVDSSNGVVEVQLNEVESLAHALDLEKDLTNGAIHVHTSATHGTDKNRLHDPEMAHYLQENFLTKQAESVRKLSGYANDMSKLLHAGDPSLAVYLFDEYLQKQ